MLCALKSHSNRSDNCCAAATLLFIEATLSYVCVCVCVFWAGSSSVLHQEEAQEERKGDDHEHDPGYISCELRDASLSDAAACWGVADVSAHGSKLGFVECASQRTSETSAARQVSDEVEKIGTDD